MFEKVNFKYPLIIAFIALSVMSYLLYTDYREADNRDQIAKRALMRSLELKNDSLIANAWISNAKLQAKMMHEIDSTIQSQKVAARRARNKLTPEQRIKLESYKSAIMLDGFNSLQIKTVWGQ